MNADELSHDELPDDLPAAAVDELVRYDEAKANGLAGERLLGILPSEDQACLDLMHRVWPDLASSADSAESAPPKTLGDFRLLRELGRGGMGTVYEAEQVSMGRRVALKVLPFAALANENSLQRFRNEVRAAAALDHPHIVSVYAAGEDRGIHYFAMQLIRGRTLADLIKELCALQTPDAGTLTNREVARTTVADRPHIATVATSHRSTERFREAARLGIQAAGALQHAHDQGVLHRDIKPSNLLLDRESGIYVTDFGLARIESDAGLTMTGDILGTLRYMAPEQALVKDVVIDHRTDIYSLGATLYELLALQPAFGETDRAQLLKQIAFDEPRSLRKVDRLIPIELETIVLKAMAKSRDERYQTARHFADDLQAYLDHRPIKARAPTLMNRAAKWSRRHQSLVWTVSLALVVLSAILALSMARVQRAQNRAVAALEETSELLYTSDMSLAYQIFEKGWSDEVQRILDRQRPTNGRPDRRELEWYFLKKLAEPPASFTLSGHKGAVNELAVFPDRHRLASVGDDGTLRIWDLRAQQMVRSIALCDKPLYSVAISPDGRFVAAASDTLYLCDLSAGASASELHRSDANIESIAFSKDGQQLVAGARYEEVCVLSLDGKVINRISCNSRVQSLEYVAGEPLLLIPTRRGATRADLVGFVQIRSADLSEVKRELDSTHEDFRGGTTIARTSPCGRFVVAGETYHRKAVLFDRTSGRVVTETPVSRDRVNDLAYSPDGKAIAVGYANGCLEYFRLNANGEGYPEIDSRPVVMDAHQNDVNSVQFVDEKSLSTCGADGLIRIWNLATNAATAFNVSDQQIEMDLSSDGQMLLCTSRQEIFLIDVNRNKVVSREYQPEAQFVEPNWSPSGDRAAIGDTKSQSVVVLDRSGRKVYSIPHGDRPSDIAFSHDGTLLAIISATKLQLCRADSGQEVASRILSAKETVGAKITFAHSGRYLAYAQPFGPITLLEATHMDVLNEFSCGSNTFCLAFSPDDSVIVSGHGDSNIRLWDSKSGRLRGEMTGHENAVNGVALSPNGQTLLSASDDGTVRIWSVHHARGIGVVSRRPLQGGPKLSCNLSMSSDAKRLAVLYRSTLREQPDVLVWNFDTNSTN